MWPCSFGCMKDGEEGADLENLTHPTSFALPFIGSSIPIFFLFTMINN